MHQRWQHRPCPIRSGVCRRYERRADVVPTLTGHNPDYAFAVIGGVVHAVFRIDGWKQSCLQRLTSYTQHCDPGAQLEVQGPQLDTQRTCGIPKGGA